MSDRHLAARLCVWALPLALSACGGGGSSESGSATVKSTGADATHGALILDVTGGASRGVEHVWVTIQSIALHKEADRAWSSSDSSWTVVNLSSPLVVDLTTMATSSHSDMTRLLDTVQVPVGTYTQIRLFPAAHDAALTSAAQNAGLQYNAQVDYKDSSNVSHSVPLEWPQIEMGWRVAGSFVFTAYNASHYVVQADLMQSLVRFNVSDALDHFTFRPTLRAYDTGSTGAIFGFLSPAYVCGNASAPAEPNCAKDIVITAQALSADGLRHESVRRFKVGSTGGFTLYPLPTGTQFDVVITGQHLRPMVIKNVAVTPSAAANILAWTTLGSSSAPIDLQSAIQTNATRSVTVSAAVTPKASRLYWGQTPDASGKPYELALMPLDPFAGTLSSHGDLPQGQLRVATYDSSAATPSFSDVTAQEGSDTFAVTTLATVYDDPSAVATRTPTLSSASVVSVNNASRTSGIGTGTLTVTLTGTLSYDDAWVVVSDVNGIVDTQSVSSAGTVTFTVPAGSQAAAASGGALYAVSVRASRTSGALQWVRAGSVLDMRSASSASVSLALP